jgi:hypothetical protein
VGFTRRFRICSLEPLAFLLNFFLPRRSHGGRRAPSIISFGISVILFVDFKGGGSFSCFTLNNWSGGNDARKRSSWDADKDSEKPRKTTEVIKKLKKAIITGGVGVVLVERVGTASHSTSSFVV